MAQGIDVEKVLRGIVDDPTFSGMPEAAVAAFRELVDPPPEAVLDVLDVKMTVAVLARLRLAIAQRAVARGFAYKLCEAVRQLPDAGRLTPDVMDADLREGQKVYAEMMLMGPIWLSRRGLKERDALAHPRVGRFRAETMAAYDAGTLTVRRLLELQPAVIVEGNV